jgi:hypothetical protein
MYKLLPYDKHLNCPICLNPFNEPVMLDCLHTFCFKCISNHLSNSKTCPIDRHLNPTILKVPLIINQILDNIQVTCNNCSTKTQKHLFKTHLEECLSFLGSCSLSEFGCDFVGSANELVFHDQICQFVKLKPILLQLKNTTKHVDDIHKNQSKIDDLIAKNARLESRIKDLELEVYNRIEIPILDKLAVDLQVLRNDFDCVLTNNVQKCHSDHDKIRHELQLIKESGKIKNNKL